MKYTQFDVDLYTDACAEATRLHIEGYRGESVEMGDIADSLRPCYYDGPNN